jgi:hypothetical protein
MCKRQLPQILSNHREVALPFDEFLSGKSNLAGLNCSSLSERKLAGATRRIPGSPPRNGGLSGGRIATKCRRIPARWLTIAVRLLTPVAVMPGLVPGIHVFT